MRTSPVHYIDPSAISITPNANNSHRDIAVYVAKGTKIKVRCPRAGLGMDADTSTYQEWTISGRNRRLADTTGTQEYTIYARLPKNSKDDGYLIFSPKTIYGDKYQYLTLDTVNGLADIEGIFISDGNWYVRLGDVSVADNGLRTVTLDTGILGTDDYNNNWAQNPDDLPLRIELGCTIDDEDVGLNPYVYWNQSLVLTATLVEGWTRMDIQRFDHWEIMRKTDDNPAESNWLDNTRKAAFGTSGEITLSHNRNSDDFNGAVATTFTIMAMGLPENSDSSGSSSSEDTVLVVLKTATITVLSETIERYELALSANIVGYNPQANTFDPTRITVRIRATDQRGDVFELTKGQFDNAGLAVEYAPIDSNALVPLTFSGESTAVATASLNTATAFAAQQSLNVRLVRIIEIDSNSDSSSSDGTDVIELMQQTIAFFRDGEDSKEREWIFLRSQAAITFGTQEHPNPADIAYGQVAPTQAAGHVTDDSNQDGWVPEGWWDEMQGTGEDTPYEYGSYRDYIHDSDVSSESSSSDDGGHWGPFSTPKIWSHYGKDGKDSIRLDLDNEHKDFLYDDADNRKSDIVTSQARLYDGPQQKTTGITWAVSCYDDDNHWVIQGNNYTDTNAKAKINSTGLLTVEEIYVKSAKVRVRAIYNNKYYYAAFTANKQSQDRYELVLSPNAIPYNPATYTSQAIAISVTRQDITGGRIALSFGSYNDKTKISATSGKGYLRLFAPVKKSVAQDTYDYVPTQITSASFIVPETHADEKNNILFQLRKYEDCEASDTYGAAGVLVDYETVPINKAENGAPGTIYQRRYRSLNVAIYPESYTIPTTENAPSGWGAVNVPSQISTTARYRWMIERYSDDNGTTWSNWSPPVITEYLAEDGTSISIKGQAAAVIPWGGSLPASSTDGSLYLMNNDDTNSINQYNNGSWDAVTVAIGDGYLVDGHLWLKLRETASVSVPRWEDMGQIKGDKGDDAEYYALSSPDIVTFRRNYAGVASAVTTSLVLALTHSVGNTQEWLTDIPNGMTLKTSTNGTTWATASPQSLERAVATDFVSGSNVHPRVYYGLFKGSTLIDSDYTDVQYEVQRMLVPAGTYEDKQYNRTINTTPLVYVDIGNWNGTYWFLVADNNGTESPYIAPGSDDNVWQQASEFDVVLTKMLFARFANLGSFIVYDRYFFSQYGDIINSSGAVVQSINDVTPNYNGQVGYSYFDPTDPMATTRGTHSLGKSVWFRPTKCINALTGDEWGASGNVHFKQNGDVFIKGEVHATSGEFTGTVKATNFFHGVVIHGEETVAYCTQAFLDYLEDNDLDDYISNFAVGQYYTEEEIRYLSDDQVGIDSSGMVMCTGPADIVVIKDSANDTYPCTITLPLASDYEGKIVEIIDTRYTLPSSSNYVGNLYAKQADDGNKMKGNFSQSISIGSSITLNGNYDHDGGNYRLIAYNGYWVKLNTT